ncbi:hypothetical protein CJ030_MR7G000375 [Morella rubra]|uniref:Uncharacterized protein n=1 Tax=Morella rubra TaxID=262757 RepID=A0A6A1V4P7_9ROSI|nr:hypothetical protein CJ030_MR7G000375 [Morella rubra]
MGCAVMWPMYLGLECQLSLKEFLWFYTPIRSTQVDRFWYFRPRNQGVSPITSYRTPIKVGTIVIFLYLVLDGSVSLVRIVKVSLPCVGFWVVPDQYRRDIKGLTPLEQAHVDAILEVGSIDWNALVCRENEGLEDVSPMLSPTSGVRTEIPVPAVKVIREIETPFFSVLLMAPPGHGELPSSSRISNQSGTLTSERLEANEGDRPLAPAGFQYAVLLSDSAYSGGLDLSEAAGGVEVHSGTISSSGALPSITLLVMETPLEEPRTSGAVVIGDSGISTLDLANESTTPAVNVAGGSAVLSVPSGDVEESDSEPSALPSWRSRPYAQPLLNEEMMEDALRALRHAKIDRLTRSLSHCVSLVAALDAVELKHDEELESSRLELRKLEGDLESQRKLVEELRTVSRGTHLQMQTYEARVMDLERDIAFRDTEVAELR